MIRCTIVQVHDLDASFHENETRTFPHRLTDDIIHPEGAACICAARGEGLIHMRYFWRAPAAIVGGTLGILASWYVVIFGAPHTNIEVADLWLGRRTHHARRSMAPLLTTVSTETA